MYKTRFFITITVLGCLFTQPTLVSAGWPVIDVPVFGQQILGGLQRVESLTEQLKQTKLKIMEYENTVRNTAAPAVFVFDDIMQDFKEFEEASAELNSYMGDVVSRYGSAKALNSRLKELADPEYYRQSPCYSSTGCSHEEKKILAELHIVSQKQHSEANWAAFKAVKADERQNQASLEEIKALQKQVTTADGAMKAMQAANQLSAKHATQLAAIREIFSRVATALVTGAMQAAEQKAQQEAEQRLMREKAMSSSWNCPPTGCKHKTNDY